MASHASFRIVDVNDPKLAAAMKQYPHHILNGSEEIISLKGRDGKMIDQPKPSLLVPIPQKAPSALEAGAPAPEQPNLLSPQSDQDDLARRLRSVGSDSSKSGK